MGEPLGQVTEWDEAVFLHAYQARVVDGVVADPDDHVPDP